jgi:hypothetical protein
MLSCRSLMDPSVGNGTALRTASMAEASSGLLRCARCEATDGASGGSGGLGPAPGGALHAAH